jgi:hypothetical protein
LVLSNKEKIVIGGHYRSRIALRMFVVKDQTPDNLEGGFHSPVKRRIPGGREDGGTEGSKVFGRVELVPREKESEVLDDFASPAGGDGEDWPGIVEGSALDVAPDNC